jgi:hypothetical protein
MTREPAPRRQALVDKAGAVEAAGVALAVGSEGWEAVEEIAATGAEVPSIRHVSRPYRIETSSTVFHLEKWIR